MNYMHMLALLVLVTSCTTFNNGSSSSQLSSASETSSGVSIESSSLTSSSDTLGTSITSSSTSDAPSETPSSTSSSLQTISHTYIANPGPDEQFFYWKHTLTDKLLSRQTPFTTEVTNIEDIKPVYVRMGEYDYSTQFEGTKSSYRRGEVTLEQRNWIFDDAVFGSLSGDKVESGRAARLHGGGSIQTSFGMMHPSSLTFKTAVYGSDTPGAALAIQFSQDGWFWQTLETVTPTSTLSVFHYTFDLLSLYLEENYDPSQPVYIKILNQNNETPLDGVRINIDSLVIERHMDAPDFPRKDYQNPRVRFLYSDPVPNVLSKDASFSPPTCTYVEEDTLASGDCDVVSAVNPAKTGDYTLTYAMQDTFGYTITETFTLTVLDDPSLLERDYDLDYDGIEGLYGRPLMQKLREQAFATIQPKPYSEGKTFLPLSDVNPLNPNEALAIYTGNSLSSAWDGGVTWQREHVWPNSRLGVRRVAENDANLASDLHNLRFIEASVNASRSNKFFDSVTTSSTFNPGDDAGDVARIMFYMAMMYDHLRLTDAFPSEQEYMTQGARGGLKQFLLQAHRDDPVSAFETYRHAQIRSYQGNPNPFIDYPDLVTLLFY